MELLTDYIGKMFVGKKLHLKCDCTFPLDVTGVCVGYSISSNEVLLALDINGKIVKFGENHPKLQIEVL